jgi:hypothetical protein
MQVVYVCAIKACRGSGGIAPLILTSAVDGSASATLHHGEGAPALLGGPQGQSGHFAEKNISCCSRICTPHSAVTVPTELSWFAVKNNQKYRMRFWEQNGAHLKWSQNCDKSFHLLFHMEQLGSHWTDFN